MALHACCDRRTENGFTLVELSIVLVIIGLIIGGVFAGKSLMRSAKIQSVITDQVKYTEATKQFKEKYNFLPGDFPNATDYWSAMTTCPPAAGATNDGTLTCNGNGNGQVNFQTYTTRTDTEKSESFLFWQHLANAKMIEGTYNGVAGSAGKMDNKLGVNVPRARVKDIGYGIAYAGVISAGKNIYNNSTSFFDGNYGHVFIIGGYASNDLPTGPLLTSTEARAIDKKFDDGLPATGTVQTWKDGSTYNPTPSGSTVGCSSSTDYYLETAAMGSVCSLVVITGF